MEGAAAPRRGGTSNTSVSPKARVIRMLLVCEEGVGPKCGVGCASSVALLTIPNVRLSRVSAEAGQRNTRRSNARGWAGSTAWYFVRQIVLRGLYPRSPPGAGIVRLTMPWLFIVPPFTAPQKRAYDRQQSSSPRCRVSARPDSNIILCTTVNEHTGKGNEWRLTRYILMRSSTHLEHIRAVEDWICDTTPLLHRKVSVRKDGLGICFRSR